MDNTAQLVQLSSVKEEQKFSQGTNAGRGNDDTIYALITGYVKFERRRNRVYASVYPTRVQNSTNAE